MQQELFDQFRELRPVPEIAAQWLTYVPEFLKRHNIDQNKLIEQLSSNVTWQQPQIKVYNKWHRIPRLQAWFGDIGVNYKYSGVVHQATGWPNFIVAIKDKINLQFGTDFNSTLINRYRNGDDKMGWHADNEAELGTHPTVAILSLGCDRDIQFKHLASNQTASMTLASGSLLLMKSGMQSIFHHQIPQRKRIDSERISLTFRHIINA